MQQTQEERLVTLGSSDAGAAIGVCPWKSQVDLWLEKTGAIPPADLSNNEPVHFGNVLEDVIAQEFARRTGKKVRRRNQTFAHRKHEFLTCHPDRTIDGEDEILECKSSSAWLANQWGETGSDEIPDYYLAQVYHQMEVMGKTKVTVAALIGGNDFRMYPIRRDDTLAKQILDTELAFWDYVTRREEPAPASEDDVNALWRFSTKEVMPSNPELENTLHQLKALREQRTEIEEQEEYLRMAVKDAMKNKHAIVRDDDTVICTWNTGQQSFFDKKRLAEDQPETVEAYSEKRDVRRFLAKWKHL